LIRNYLVGTGPANDFQILAVPDHDVVPEKMTEGHMVPTIQNEFLAPEVIQELP